MNPSTQEEESLSARSYGLQKNRGREGAATKSWLRLRAAVVAAAVAVLFALGTGAAQFAQAQVESLLHNFTGSDGNLPGGNLIMDSAGNLYGTIYEGGSSTCGPYGCGTVLELSPPATSGGKWTETALYSFTGTDGGGPELSLIMDSSGNLYGTTFEGGSTYSSSSPGDGTVFELSPPATSGGKWTETVLYSFTGTDGYEPWAGLIMDSAGNLYGTTFEGGSTYSSSSPGYGTVFELSPPATSGGKWTETVLHNFTGTDGYQPAAGLIMDSAGNLYGTTVHGGSTYSSSSSTGTGTVFELSPPATSGGSWTEKVLYNFTGTDGYQPEAGLIRDSAGNLYGTTASGGSTYSSSSSTGTGTVFELSPPATSGGSWTEKVLYNFTGTNGDWPSAGLIRDSAGNLYSTTASGGSTYTSSSPGDGTVFELSSPATSGGSWTEKFLYSFTGTNGYMPAGLIKDSAGNLYGSTAYGGSMYSSLSSLGDGIVFGIAPVTLSATSLDFGSVGVDTTSAAQTVTITNIGGGNFSYSTASLSGANAGDFAVTNGCSTAAAPNGTCPVSVTFTPSTATAETASLNLSQGGMTQTVSLTGTGAYPTVNLSASSLTFTSQPVGSTSSSQTVTVTNSSTVTLNITSVGITGDFAIGSNTCNAVAAGKTCTVGVTFTPTAAGARTGTLIFNDNTSSGSQTVSLTGTGAITTVSVSPTTLSYPLQAVGTKSADQMVTVMNTGGSTSLALSAITASTNFAIDTAKTTCTASTLVAPGGSCQVAVAFAPTTGGPLTGTLTLTDDASPSTQTVALSGTGAAVSASPTSLTFGSTVVGTTSSAQTVMVTNTGTTSISLTGLTATGDFAVDATGTTCSTSTALAGSATCKVAVTFTPTAGGMRSGSLAIASNGGTGTVVLSGTGEDFALTPGSIGVTVGSAGYATFALQLSPEGGFNQAVSVACSGAPKGATCTVNNTPVTLDGTDSVAVNLRVTTTGNAMVGPGPGNFGPPPSGSLPLAVWLAIIGLLALMALAKFSPKGGRVRRAAPWATLALLAALCAGCGGGSSGMSSTNTSSNSTPAGTYTMTVTAKSGSLTHTTQVTLTVQ